MPIYIKPEELERIIYDFMDDPSTANGDRLAVEFEKIARGVYNRSFRFLDDGCVQEAVVHCWLNHRKYAPVDGKCTCFGYFTTLVYNSYRYQAREAAHHQKLKARYADHLRSVGQ